MIRSNSWYSGVTYVGLFHPNVYSLYMIHVQVGEQNSAGYIQYATGWYITGKRMHVIAFEYYDYYDNTCAIES